MTAYRIVCIRTEPPHRHVASVGMGSDPLKPSDIFTIKQVWDMIDQGDVFYTEDVNGHTAPVRKDKCRTIITVSGKETECIVKTLKSSPDEVGDNNLDNLAPCP